MKRGATGDISTHPLSSLEPPTGPNSAQPRRGPDPGAAPPSSRPWHSETPASPLASPKHGQPGIGCGDLWESIENDWQLCLEIGIWYSVVFDIYFDPGLRNNQIKSAHVSSSKPRHNVACADLRVQAGDAGAGQDWEGISHLQHHLT